MLKIIISGATGVGKTLLARSLENQLERGKFRYRTSDHALVTSENKFSEKRKKIEDDHNASDIDVSIIVIDDGEKSLRVEYKGEIPHSLANVLFPQKPLG